jgi:integrase
MSIYKRGNSWYVNFTFKGTRINRKVADTKTAARRIEEELKTKLRLKMLNVSDLTNTADHIMFHLVAEEYIAHVEKTKSKRYAYETKLDYHNHLKDFFSHYALTDISNDLLMKYQSLKKSQTLIPFKEMRKVRKFHIRIKGHESKTRTKQDDKKLTQSRVYSNRTVNILMGIVRKVMNFAVAKGYIEEVRLKYPHLKEPKKLHAFITPDEFEKFASSISYDLAEKRIRFGRLTGMRPAELSHLAWPDVDFDLEIVKIQGKGEWKPKTDEERIIPLCDEALAILRELSGKKKGKWVFSHSDKPVKCIQRSLKTASKKAGLSRHVTPNMLRHTFATHALAAGSDLKSVMDIMGHRNIETTNRYLHSLPENLKRTVQLVQDFKSAKPLKCRDNDQKN